MFVVNDQLMIFKLPGSDLYYKVFLAVADENVIFVTWDKACHINYSLC